MVPLSSGPTSRTGGTPPPFGGEGRRPFACREPFDGGRGDGRGDRGRARFRHHEQRRRVAGPRRGAGARELPAAGRGRGDVDLPLGALLRSRRGRRRGSARDGRARGDRALPGVGGAERAADPVAEVVPREPAVRLHLDLRRRASASRSWRRTFCAPLREAASQALGAPVVRAVVGRPVRFVRRREAGRTRPSPSRASARRSATPASARSQFEYEPVGAAWHYERGLDHGRAGPDRRLRRRHQRLLAAPRRPRRARSAATAAARCSATTASPSPATPSTAGWCGTSSRRSSAAAPSSARCSGACCRSRAGSTRTSSAGTTSRSCARRRRSQLLLDLRREALEPERIAALLHLVEHDLGYLLFRAVERAKLELSERDAHALRASSTRARASTARVTRAEFEGWIARELAARRRLRRPAAPARAGPRRRRRPRLPHRRLVPRPRRAPASSPSASARRSCESGGELTSVASGLALRAASPF